MRLLGLAMACVFGASCSCGPAGSPDGGAGGGTGGAGGGGAGARILVADPKFTFTSLATDGTYAYVSITAGDGGEEIRRIPISGGTLTPVGSGAASQIAAMVSDGQDLFYATVAPNEIRRFPLDGGPELVLAQNLTRDPQMATTDSELYLLDANTFPAFALYRIAKDAAAGSGLGLVASGPASTANTSNLSIVGGRAVWAGFDSAIWTIAVPGPGSLLKIEGDGGVVTGASISTAAIYAARKLPQPSGPAKGQFEVWTPAGSLTTVLPLSSETQRVLADDRHVFFWEYAGQELIHRTNLDGSGEAVISTDTVNTLEVVQTPQFLLSIGVSGVSGQLWVIPK